MLCSIHIVTERQDTLNAQCPSPQNYFQANYQSVILMLLKIIGATLEQCLNEISLTWDMFSQIFFVTESTSFLVQLSL